jgi:glyoxylase I family protein
MQEDHRFVQRTRTGQKSVRTVSETGEAEMTATSSEHSNEATVGQAVAGFHGVRYLVTDVKRASGFYTGHLGFRLDHERLPAFASVSLGPLTILLSGPEASGSRPLPSGERQTPGGSNRVVLRVRDLPAVIEALRSANVTFRGAMESGPGGRQIQVEDPDGNPVELFEPAQREQ